MPFIIDKPVQQLPTAESVTNADHILIYKDTDGKAYLAAGTLFRGDPGQNATINGVNALTLAAGDNVAISQSGGTVTLSANISGVFIFKGPATLATLPALTAANLGFTYNMTEAFTTTADFIEGAGKAYSAGADVAICDAGNGVYRYNVLSVDLSGLVPATRQINGHALSSDVALSKSDVGLGNVDNTSDLNKPISTATQTALNAKQDKLSVTGAANKGVYVSASGVVSAMTHTLDADVPSNAVFTDTTYTPASAAPLMDGTAAVGTSAKYARENHVHPTDTSRASAADVAAIKALLQNAVFYRTASGNPATFSDGYPENLRKLSVTLAPTQSGSGDPSPTNVRPISGVSSVTVTRTGKNLLNVTTNGETKNGVALTVNRDSEGSAISVVVNGTASANAVFTVNSDVTAFLKKGETYVLSGCPGGGGADSYELQIPNPTWAHEYGSGLTFTANVGTTKTLRLVVQSGASVSNLAFYPMVRPASVSDATFEPYKGRTVTVPLVDSNNNNAALTVYGGTLDVTSGTLTVTWANLASYNGETLPGVWMSDRDAYAAGTTPTTGAQVVYELAPADYQTYQLAAAQLPTLPGCNVIFADAGSVSVEYRADTSAIGGGA